MAAQETAAADISATDARVIIWLSEAGDSGLEQSTLTRRLNVSANCKAKEREAVMSGLQSKNLISSGKKIVPGKRTPTIWFLTEDGTILAKQIEEHGIQSPAAFNSAH